MGLGRGGVLLSFLLALGLKHWTRRGPDELARDVGGLAECFVFVSCSEIRIILRVVGCVCTCLVFCAPFNLAAERFRGDEAFLVYRDTGRV